MKAELKWICVSVKTPQIGLGRNGLVAFGRVKENRNGLLTFGRRKAKVTMSHQRRKQQRNIFQDQQVGAQFAEIRGMFRMIGMDLVSSAAGLQVKTIILSNN